MQLNRTVPHLAWVWIGLDTFCHIVITLLLLLNLWQGSFFHYLWHKTAVGSKSSNLLNRLLQLHTASCIQSLFKPIELLQIPVDIPEFPNIKLQVRC